MTRRAVGILVVGLAGLMAWGGWVAVETGEVVVVRRFGRALAEPWGPGPHWSWPLGVDRVTRVRLDEVRRLEFGRVEAAGPLDDPGAGEYLTGDLNIVRARGEVQYRVSDPVAFVLCSGDRDRLLSEATEAALARALASRGIDAPLRSGRPEVAREIQAEVARSASTLGLGVAILGVNLTDARPPTEVEPAFAEAQSALAERDRRLVEAGALAANLGPSARSAAASSTDAAEAHATRSAEAARAEAARFVALLAEADRSRPLTVRRLYRDALRDLLPRVRRKVLTSPDDPVDLGITGGRDQ